MNIFDENITTEFVADITNEKMVQKREIEGFQYNMFQSTIIKDSTEYYCERINITSDRNINGIHGLFFSNNTNNQDTRFEGKEIDTEDPRLFICNDKIYVVFNVFSPFPGYKRSMAISEYNHFQPIYLRIEDHQEQIVEKNWSPCVVNNQLYFIYIFDPLIVLHYDFNQEGICTIHYKQNPEVNIRDIYTPHKCLRGSSSFIPFMDSFLGELYIGLCHSYIYKDDQYYYYAFLCILNVTKWEIVYISKPVACRSLLTDAISKYKDTDIINNFDRYYYKDTCDGSIRYTDITLVYPTSIYPSSTDLGESSDFLIEYMIILNLNKYSLKNKMTIDYVAILQQIIFEKEEDTCNRPWDDIVRQYSMDLINNSL
jgi:hypothetical protein